MNIRDKTDTAIALAIFKNPPSGDSYFYANAYVPLARKELRRMDPELRSTIWILSQTVAGFLGRYRAIFERTTSIPALYRVKRPDLLRSYLSGRGVDAILSVERAHQREARQTKEHSMCTQTHPPVASADKAPSTGKVFIDGKNRPLFISSDVAEAEAAIETGLPALRVTNLNGEATTIPRERVQSVVRPTASQNPIEMSPHVFDGKQHTIRGLAVHNAGLIKDNDSPFVVENAAECAVAIAEDLASAEVVVVNMRTGEIMWANPAVPERSIRRTVRAMRLLGEAEQIVTDEYEDKTTPDAEVTRENGAEPEQALSEDDEVHNPGA